jgi:calcineurin-like phosphoesterase family protein
VKNALCLRPSAPAKPEMRFIHLTDLHVAARNDIWAQEVNSTVNPKPGGAQLQFKNFNDRLRAFIEKANTLADEGELDFVLALGDLIDFVNYGIGEPKPGENNWRTLIDILTGGGDESDRDNKGLRVPVFTTTGNHDWRPNPYPPEYNPDLFGLTKKQLQKFDYLYADDPDVVGAKILEVHSELISKGSPILARSWWGEVVSGVLRGVEVGWGRFTTRTSAFAGEYLRNAVGILLGLGLVGEEYELRWLWKLLQYFCPCGFFMSPAYVLLLLLSLVIVMAVLRLAQNWAGGKLREKITSLIGIESDVRGLWDYFLEVNPYFNYAFRLEKCYFLVLDTGHDALTAESFWDNGGKKIRHLKVRDNIIGGSPETVGFFAPDQYYPCSQITWLKSVLDCVQREQHGQLAREPRECRVFVGLHAPPANISSDDRRRADSERSGRTSALLMKRGGLCAYDIHYGTANHYISEFFYQCLGYSQSKRDQVVGPGVDVVLSGHVHWNIDFKLVKPAHGAASLTWDPEVYYGNFSDEVEAAAREGKGDHKWWGRLLLQTAACGPPSQTASKTPYYRLITVDGKQAIRSLASRN